MRAWAPEFIVYACPFIVCTIIGPAFDNVRAAHNSKVNQYSIQLDLLKLVLRRIGSVWDIGTAGLSESLIMILSLNSSRVSDCLCDRAYPAFGERAASR